MALPNGAGGYQVGDGNLGEISFYNTDAPAALTGASVTITAAQLAGGLCTMDPGSTSAGTYVFPTGALLDAAFPSLKVGSTFDFRVINTTTAGVITMTTNTGWTIGSGGSQGLMTIAATAGTVRSFRARRLGDNSWALYAIS